MCEDFAQFERLRSAAKTLESVLNDLRKERCFEACQKVAAARQAVAAEAGSRLLKAMEKRRRAERKGAAHV